MTLFCQQIQQTYADQPQYLHYLQLLTQRHLEALDLFLDDKLEASMKTLYDYDSMRQKQKFNRAMDEIVQLRLELGLPC
jgi:hypothetical protein